MQGPGPGPNQPPNMPSGSMNMPPSSHGSMGGYNHTVPSSQGIPAQSQMNMTQGQPMGNYGPRPNMNMQPNQGKTFHLLVSFCFGLSFTWVYLSNQVRLEMYLLLTTKLDTTRCLCCQCRFADDAAITYGYLSANSKYVSSLTQSNQATRITGLQVHIHLRILVTGVTEELSDFSFTSDLLLVMAHRF